jgi:hypothetical protein
MSKRLTERIVKAAEIGTRKYVVFDDDCPGFGLCVYESGRKGFVLIYRMGGQQKRFTIGTWPAWSVIAARDEAKALKREIDRGEDPLDARKAHRTAPTVKELAERYIEEHLPKLAKTNASDQISMLQKLVLPEWKGRMVADITPTDVDRLLTKISAGRARPAKLTPTQKRRKALAPPKPTPVRANRAGEMLRKMFNLAVQWKMRPDNPAFAFRKRPETARDRFLTFDEIERLANALAVDEDQRAASIIRLCMLTGARLYDCQSLGDRQHDGPRWPDCSVRGRYPARSRDRCLRRSLAEHGPGCGWRKPDGSGREGVCQDRGSPPQASEAA